MEEAISLFAFESCVVDVCQMKKQLVVQGILGDGLGAKGRPVKTGSPIGKDREIYRVVHVPDGHGMRQRMLAFKKLSCPRKKTPSPAEPIVRIELGFITEGKRFDLSIQRRSFRHIGLQGGGEGMLRCGQYARTRFYLFRFKCLQCASDLKG